MTSTLVKLARPPPEMRIFSATFSLWSSTKPSNPLACHAGTKQAGRTGTHDHNIKTLHGLQCILSTMTVPGTEALHNERDKP